MMAVLQELQRLGKTILISSHILSELQTLCNRVGIIEKGRLIYSGPVQGVRDQVSHGRVMWVRVSSDQAQAIDLLKARKEIAEVAATDGEIKVTLPDPTSSTAWWRIFSSRAARNLSSCARTRSGWRRCSCA